MSSAGSCDKGTRCSGPKQHWSSRSLWLGCPLLAEHHGWQAIGAGEGSALRVTTGLPPSGDAGHVRAVEGEPGETSPCAVALIHSSFLPVELDPSEDPVVSRGIPALKRYVRYAPAPVIDTALRPSQTRPFSQRAPAGPDDRVQGATARGTIGPVARSR